MENQPSRPELIKKNTLKEAAPISKKKARKELIRNDPSQKYLFKHLRSRSLLTFVCYTEEVVGRIEKIKKYEVMVSGKDEAVNKTEIVYLYKSEAAGSVRMAVRIDEEVVEEKLGAVYTKAERLLIPEDILAKCFKEKREITVTMRNGHVLAGRIDSYGIFSIRLTMGGNVRVLAMRHAVYDMDYSG